VQEKKFFLASRYDKPHGILLLYFPCIWGINLNGVNTKNDMLLYFIFLIGACGMRALGCLWNDFNDKDFDIKVKRTKSRLIASKKITNKTIDQIKNISQQEKIEPNLNKDEVINELKIGSFESLINLCTERKEAKLKYELETNTNLVSFSEGLIEISFNENLDKDFIKNLSNKLYEWTSKRWIISLSKNQGQISKKEKNKIDEKKIFDDVKKSEAYKKVIEAFPDAELINVELKED